MAYDGESIRRVFNLVLENPIPTTPTLDILSSTLDKCCSDNLIQVYADATTDEFKNDKSTIIKVFSSATTSVVMTLQEFVNGAWTDLVVLATNSLGTFYPFGFLPNTVGYTLDWYEVNDYNGIGAYRIKFEAVSFAGTYTTYSDQYCLSLYNPISVNGTVKLEWYLNGTFADSTNDARVIDYGTSNLYQQIRLDGIFGKPTSEKAEEFIRYQNGKEVFLKSEQTPEYTLMLKPQTPTILQLLQYQVFQQDSILVTDYNRNNHYSWIKKDVKVTGGFAPEWDWNSLKASVELKLTNANNNFKRRL
jgi:hypothetical protein